MNQEEFQQQKELIELSHKYKMEELDTEMKNRIRIETVKHEKELERERIRSAEIRKNIWRRNEH